MRQRTIGILIAWIAAATLASAASAVSITYVVDRSLSAGGSTLTVVGTVTVDDAGPTVTDWEFTIASAALGRSITLNSSNSTFFSSSATLTPTSTQLSIDIGTNGLWGAHLRDDATSLRHEWFLLEENGPLEQASLDFANPDPDAVFVIGPRTNPTILLAVPEPAVLAQLAVGLTGLTAFSRRRRRALAGEQS